MGKFVLCLALISSLGIARPLQASCIKIILSAAAQSLSDPEAELEKIKPWSELTDAPLFIGRLIKSRPFKDADFHKYEITSNPRALSTLWVRVDKHSEDTVLYYDIKFKHWEDTVKFLQNGAVPIAQSRPVLKDLQFRYGSAIDADAYAPFTFRITMPCNGRALRIMDAVAFRTGEHYQPSTKSSANIHADPFGTRIRKVATQADEENLSNPEIVDRVLDTILIEGRIPLRKVVPVEVQHMIVFNPDLYLWKSTLARFGTFREKLPEIAEMSSTNGTLQVDPAKLNWEVDSSHWVAALGPFGVIRSVFIDYYPKKQQFEVELKLPWGFTLDQENLDAKLKKIISQAFSGIQHTAFVEMPSYQQPETSEQMEQQGMRIYVRNLPLTGTGEKFLILLHDLLESYQSY